MRSARPFYQGETGKRRGGWYAFFDDPTTHPDGTRHVQGTLQLRGATARSVGERVEIVFDGLRMGSFDGGLAYTFYPGSRLIQQEAVLTTYDADVAYYYDAGLDMAARRRSAAGQQHAHRGRLLRHRRRAAARNTPNGLQAERVPVQARYRTLALKTAGGSVAVFPAPHQYFFPRDFTSNLGFVWYRAWRGRVALGIRQLRDENWQYYPWMNAPPGRPQRMGVFFLLSAPPRPTRRSRTCSATRTAIAFDALDGYKTLSTHWHLADTVQAMAQRLRLDAAVQAGAEGDGRRCLDDHGLSRRRASRRSHRSASRRAGRLLRGRCARQSDPEFLLIPAEEANVHLGGHWALVFPKPVYWFMDRPEERRVSSRRTRSTARSTASPTRKRCSTWCAARAATCTRRIRARRDRPGFRTRFSRPTIFRDASYLGAGWKAMPSDLSSPRLGDRAFDLLDELNNQGTAQAPARRGGRVPVRPHARALRAHEHQLRQARSPPGVRSMGRRAGAAGQR